MTHRHMISGLGAIAVAVSVWAMIATQARADVRSRAATEAAEYLIARFGSKAGRSVSVLAKRIESLAARYGDEAIMAVRKGGPEAVGLVEAAGANGAKALRVLAVHGEEGAARVLARPAAMKQFLHFGDEAAMVLVKHPGVAESLVERGGAQAVKALGAVNPRNGRRLAMLLEEDIAKTGRHAELLGVVSKHGDGAADFIWRNKEVLAGGAALTAFLANPEPFLNGTRDIAEVATDGVVKPVVSGVVTIVCVLLGVICVLACGGAALAYKYGLPKPEYVKQAFGLLKR
jgi:hypothetical protein